MGSYRHDRVDARRRGQSAGWADRVDSRQWQEAAEHRRPAPRHRPRRCVGIRRLGRTALLERLPSTGVALPEHGTSPEAIFAELDDLQRGDVQWRDGRAFSLVYYGGADVSAVAEEAYRRYSSENALNTDAFPGLRAMQSEVVAAVGQWLHAGPEGAGFMTSGGTESILMAVKAARERGRKERGIASPNVVLPTSAHAAFEKGCYYFGLESRRVSVDSAWRADVDAMEAAIDDDTVLVVGSAPQ